MARTAINTVVAWIRTDTSKPCWSGHSRPQDRHLGAYFITPRALDDTNGISSWQHLNGRSVISGRVAPSLATTRLLPGNTDNNSETVCISPNRVRRQSGFPTFISCQRQDAHVLPKRRQSHQGDKFCDVSTVPLVARWPVFLARGSDADGEPHWTACIDTRGSDAKCTFHPQGYNPHVYTVQAVATQPELCH